MSKKNSDKHPVFAAARILQDNNLSPLQLIILTYASDNGITAPTVKRREQMHIRTAQRYLDQLAIEKYLRRKIPERSFPVLPDRFTLTAKGKKLLREIYADPNF